MTYYQKIEIKKKKKKKKKKANEWHFLSNMIDDTS